ncbi:MAG: hypothetical protein JWO86_255 [Myxococcaceae bacterium]|jgi:hypothetical protein|nr:hypothetical protein [Myxococcaceae bacterium]MEA2753595.1 hypothetical protein [Myxococcales bacterium]
MNNLPRFSALFLVSFASMTLFACAAPTGAADTVEITEATAQPLLASCEGTYTRPADDGEGPLSVTLVRNEKKVCTVGGYHLAEDYVVTGIIDGKSFHGTWAGDATSFVVCTEAHCFPYTRGVASSER